VLKVGALFLVVYEASLTESKNTFCSSSLFEKKKVFFVGFYKKLIIKIA
jgi:hypothetical protein